MIQMDFISGNLTILLLPILHSKCSVQVHYMLITHINN